MLNTTFVVQSFVTLFLIVDSVGNVPIFIALIEKFSERDRVYMVKKSVFIAAAVLLIFTLLGNIIFSMLGVSMYSFQIAGGILLMIISIEMLFGRKSRTEMSEEILTEEREDLTITPMAVPLLTGPGAITSGIMLFNIAANPVDKITLVMIILVVFLLSYIILANSNLIYRILGKTGTKVVIRLMGLMLSAIAIQFIITGAKEALPVLR